MVGSDYRFAIGFAGLPGTPARHVSVDGMTPEGPNLSHWPGNRTPAAFKSDLSTGICLAVARAPAAERDAFLAGVEAVVNDHYDTDGFLSMLALVRPEIALPRADVCLAAAATGDFQSFQSDHGFAVDRIVLNLPHSPESPVASQLPGKQPGERALLCYEWLIANAEQVLDDPWSLAPLFAPELAEVHEGLDHIRAHGDRQFHANADLAVIRTRGAIHRMVLNTIASAYRVLHLLKTQTGLHVRYHDRTESWFEVASFTPPARRDLRPLAEQLQQQDDVEPGRWNADSPDQPVPELYRGIPEPQEYGQITRTLTSTSLNGEVVESAFARFFALESSAPS